MGCGPWERCSGDSLGPEVVNETLEFYVLEGILAVVMPHLEALPLRRCCLCTEAAMVADIYFKTLFVSTLAEGNPACQRCILGSEEGKPGPAEAAVKQWSCGCGLQRQCMEGHGICMPEHACARTRHACASFTCLCLFLSLLALFFPKNPKVQRWAQKHAERVRKQWLPTQKRSPA